MTYPRAHLVDENNGGYYHCTSRCVRRSWLCGRDKISGRSFEHRRTWIAKRIQLLARAFAVDLHAFAIMSNHYHIVLHLAPKRPRKWSDEEVVDRWLLRLGQKPSSKAIQLKKRNLLEHPGKIREIRSRLGSLSWFMRYINEPLARLANEEDECSGRFWEGRFKSVALLDRTALLACMVYVDLNPIRANAREKLPSPHTSARDRVTNRRTALVRLDTIGIRNRDYLELLRFTKKNRGSRDGKRQTTRPKVLEKSSYSTNDWRSWVQAFQHWYRAYGVGDSTEKYADEIGQQWIQTPVLRKLRLGPLATLQGTL